MKTILTTFVLLLIVNIAVAEIKPATIAVTGKCSKEIQANLLRVKIDLWAKFTNASSARDKVNKLTQKLRDQLEIQKIQKDEIKTLYYNVYPEYKYDEQARNSKIVGYSAQHSLEVEINNLDNAGKIVDVLIDLTQKEKLNESGLTLGQMNWDSTQKVEAENDCLSQAVKASKDRANVLAKAAGVKIKGVYLLTNNQIYSNSNIEAFSDGAAQKSLLSGRSSETKLSSAKIPIAVEISAEYLIDN